MKKLLIGLALGTATSLAVRKIARKGHKLHEHCREMMSNHSHKAHSDEEQSAFAQRRASCCAEAVEHHPVAQ